MNEDTRNRVSRGIAAARADGWSDADIQKYVYEKFPELRGGFDAAVKDGHSGSQVLDYLAGGSRQDANKVGSAGSIDDETGAGWKERFIIGSASSDEDKLARAKELYGDSVQQHGEDKRLSFIDPKTGKRTYINPSGFDFGDIAGSAREIGSVAAGILPAVFGTATTGFGGLAAGSAAGAAAGQGIDALAAGWGRSLAKDRGNAEAPMQTVSDAAREAGLETAGGIAGGYALGKAGSLVRKAFNPMKQEIVQAYRNLGLQIPTVASGTGSSLAKTYENVLGNTFLGGGIMNRARETGINSWETALENEAKRMAGGHMPAGDVSELGSRMHAAADASREDFIKRNNDFYDNFIPKYGKIPVRLKNTSQAVDDLLGDLSPNVGADAAGGIGRFVDAPFKDYRDGNLDFNSLKHARTKVGNAMSPRRGETLLPGTPDKGSLDKIYGGMSKDMKDVLTPDDRILYDQQLAREVVERKARDELNRSMLGNRTPTQTGSVLSGGNLSPETVENMAAVMPEAVDELRGSLLRLHSTPLASAGEEGAGETAVTAFNRLHGNGRGAMNPKTRDFLYSGTKERDLHKVADSLDMSRVDNTSRTAKHNHMYGILNSLPKLFQIGSTWSAGTANPLGAAAGFAIPALLARATTSRKAINYLAKPQSMLSKMMLGDSINMGTGAVETGKTLGRETGRRSDKKKDR